MSETDPVDLIKTIDNQLKRVHTQSLDLSFNENKIADAYQMYSNFKESYYGSSKAGQHILSSSSYVKNVPLIVFDCSKQQNKVKLSSVDVKIEFRFAEATPENTIISCLIIHDRIVKYNPFTNIVERLV